MLKRPIIQPWDYPRVGGEEGLKKGLPSMCRGITPAWAGKSYQPHKAQPMRKDYPRVGGEEW